MSFKKCPATTGKEIITEDAQKGAKMIYLYDVVTKIETYKIPHQLIFDMDQTPLKYIKSSNIIKYQVSKIICGNRWF